MKIVCFDNGGTPGYGIRHGAKIAAYDAARSALDLCDPSALGAPSRWVLVSQVALLPPVPAPGKVICIGLNYRAHAIEGGNPIPDYPAVFLRAATSLLAPGAAMAVPGCSDRLDYEGELAVVIGRTAKHVARADALEHVAGYACFNDGTLRDYQRKTPQWTIGKNFDGTGAFGPELVTADEMPDGARDAILVTRVNGEIRQRSPIADMIFDVATLVSLLSEVMTLEPGDVIATGTPSGVGYARNPPAFLKSGDVCEVELEGISLLTTPIVAA